MNCERNSNEFKVAKYTLVCHFSVAMNALFEQFQYIFQLTDKLMNQLL
jgi:hypothetical protein